jgi:hypothetical protein
MRFKKAETTQANLGRSTVAILWAALLRYLIVTFDPRRTDIMPNGFVLPSYRAAADFLSEHQLRQMLSR